MVPRFDNLDSEKASRTGRCVAAVWLLAYLVAVVACVSAVQSGHSINSFQRVLPAARGDLRLYWEVVHRIERGEDYYPAMHAELKRLGYPTSSIFNWRTPPVFWLMARLSGPPDGKTIILCAAAALIAAVFVIQKQELGATAAYAGSFLTLGALLPCFVSDVCVLPLEWGAVCVGLSLCSYARNQTGPAVLFAVLAALLSELALGYSMLMAVSAAGNRQWRECQWWTIGWLILGACFAWHAGMVSRTIGTDDVVQTRAWLQFLGLPFVVATAQMNCWLLPLPPWLAAIYLPTSLLGLMHWTTPTGRRCRLFALSYCMLFLCAGQPFNQYWGLLLSPPLAWGAIRGPFVLRDLWGRAQLSPCARSVDGRSAAIFWCDSPGEQRVCAQADADSRFTTRNGC